MAIKNSRRAECAMLRSDVPTKQYWKSRNVENLTEVKETEKSRDRKLRLYKR